MSSSPVCRYIGWRMRCLREEECAVVRIEAVVPLSASLSSYNVVWGRSLGLRARNRTARLFTFQTDRMFSRSRLRQKKTTCTDGTANFFSVAINRFHLSNESVNEFLHNLSGANSHCVIDLLRPRGKPGYATVNGGLWILNLRCLLQIDQAGLKIIVSRVGQVEDSSGKLWCPLCTIIIWISSR